MENGSNCRRRRTVLAGAFMGYGLDLGADIIGAWAVLLALAAALSAYRPSVPQKPKSILKKRPDLFGPGA